MGPLVSTKQLERVLGYIQIGLTPVALRRQEPGRPMVSLTLGGVIVNPGDWIVADDDGVVVIDPVDVEAVLAGAKVTEAVHQAIAEVADE